MVWTQGAGFRLAPALLTLLHQLEAAYPGQQWVTSPQTGTIGDAAHRAEANSDHNPWLDGTVRALDVAVNVHGVPGIVDVADGPPGVALLAMVNRMYAAKDPRVWPTGYGIFDGQITDWDNPGQNHSYTGSDQHHYHVHISVSTNPLGYDSTAPWPLPGESSSSGSATEIGGGDMPLTEAEWGRMQEMINAALQSQRNWITWAYGNVSKDLAAMRPEVVGLKKYLRDSFCAVGGQLAALPDGTKISSIGAALLSSNAHIDAALKAQAAAQPTSGQGDLDPILAELRKLPADVVTQLAQKLGGNA